MARQNENDSHVKEYRCRGDNWALKCCKLIYLFFMRVCCVSMVGKYICIQSCVERENMFCVCTCVCRCAIFSGSCVLMRDLTNKCGMEGVGDLCDVCVSKWAALVCALAW